MKRMLLIAIIVFAARGIAAAQKVDVLGPHVNSGRGCPVCHTPHNGANEVGRAKTRTANEGASMLWGEDVTGLTGAADGTYLKTLSATPERAGLLICLSCHDGNYAHAAMMKNEIYETVPEIYGAFHTVPTLVDKPSINTGGDISEHPVGLGAQLGCSGRSGWDCTESQGTISMEGRHSSRFAAQYGFFVKPRSYNSTSVVMCTTCHNPHLVNVVDVPRNSASVLFPPGTYATRYFLRAPYNPVASPDGSNQAAQFCRQCHADKSNEMNGSTAGSVL